MATPNFSIFALLVGLLSGGVNDLLDFVPSDAYWRAKNVAVSVEQLVAELAPAAAVDVSKLIGDLGSGEFAKREEAARGIRAAGPGAIPMLEKVVDDPDPEVANRAKGLIDEIRRASRGAAVRKLMAIRTLGEMKAKAGLPVLKTLTAAREGFVADYAARAVAQIEGRPLPSRVPSAEALRADVSLLPANCAVVGQFSFMNTKAVSIAEVAKGVPVAPGENREQTIGMIASTVIPVAEQVGNIRLEAVTIGIADDVGDNSGFVVAIVRGQFDAPAIQTVVRPMLPNWTTIDGVEVLTPERTGAVALVSNERLIGWGGPSRDKMPIKEVLAASRDNKGALFTNADMAKLIHGIEPGLAGWAACKVSPGFRAAPVIAAFDTMTMTAKQWAEGIDIRVAGEGSDPVAVKDAVDLVNRQLATAKMEIPKVAAQVPMLKPVADLVGGIVCEADGKRAALTGRFAGETSALLALPFAVVGQRSQVVQPPARAVPPPPPPPPPVQQRRGAEQLQDVK